MGRRAGPAAVALRRRIDSAFPPADAAGRLVPWATLIAAPGSGALRPALADGLRDSWVGGAIRWLSPGEAAEFAIPEMPADLQDVWSEMQEVGVDLAVQSRRGPRKMLVADMDSTMIQQECIDELAAEAGVGGQVAGITARAMNAEIGFEDALRERVRLLAGLEVSAIDRTLERRIAYVPGARALLATMKAQGAYALLVSGGFTAFALPVGLELGFDEVRANRLLVEGGRLTGRAAEPVLGRDAKASALEEVAGRLGIGTEDVLAVGDGANDLGMLGIAGSGVAFRAKPAVAARCDLRINHGDLTALLYLQGYGSDGFIAPPRRRDGVGETARGDGGTGPESPRHGP